MVVRVTEPEPEDESPAEEASEPTSHDLIFKTVCRHFFDDVVTLTLPDLADKLDLQDVEFLEKEAFSDFPKGKRAIADLVVKAKNKDDEEQIVLVQVEIEAEFRSNIDERAFYYYLYLRLKYQLPVVIVVIFLRGGQVPRETREYVDVVEGREVCVFKYEAFALRRHRAETFVEESLPLAPGLAALMPSPWDPVEKKLNCLRAITRADVDEARRYLLVQLVEVYVELDETEQERFDAAVQEEANEEVQKMVITWEDALAASKAEGKDEGKVEGKVEGLRNSILEVLRLRLSDVPAFVQEKLEAIDSLERLRDILKQAVVVDSVDDLALER